ncbi:MAG: hypothetical protein AB1610_11090 [Nitrospirota bacterium]
MCKKIFVIFLLMFFSYLSEGLAGIKCIDAEGEAVILNNDIPSSKAEAVARAKWSAIEQTIGVEVKAQSIVQNFAIVDDAVSKNIQGLVTGYKVLAQDTREDTFWVRANVCIESRKAEDALMSLALNNSIAVFIPARKPKVISEYDTKHSSYLHTTDEYEETNILSETVIGKLIEHGYQVVDVAPTHAMDAADIEKAVKSGNYMTVRSLMYKFLSNVLLIGKIDYTVSTKKGEDVGYGISMPFHNVTVRLTYRLITRDKTGKNVILHAGVEEAKGMAMSVNDATEKGIKELADKVTPAILNAMAKHAQGASKKIIFTVRNVPDISTNFEIKEILQNTTWVTSVEEKKLGEFLIGYPENIVYLINSLVQRNFRLVDFTNYSTTMDYR